jgi:hypothetical protein
LLWGRPAKSQICEKARVRRSDECLLGKFLSYQPRLQDRLKFTLRILNKSTEEKKKKGEKLKAKNSVGPWLTPKSGPLIYNSGRGEVINNSQELKVKGSVFLIHQTY